MKEPGILARTRTFVGPGSRRGNLLRNNRPDQDAESLSFGPTRTRANGANQPPHNRIRGAEVNKGGTNAVIFPHFHPVVSGNCRRNRRSFRVIVSITLRLLSAESKSSPST